MHPTKSIIDSNNTMLLSCKWKIYSETTKHTQETKNKEQYCLITQISA